MKRKQLKASAVRQWLQSLSPRSYFRAGYCDACPIARFLGKGVIVSRTWAIYRTYRDELPTWASLFVRAIDSKHAYGGRVSRDKALETLLNVAYRRA
jgi:hypothetical protein